MAEITSRTHKQGNLKIIVLMSLLILFALAWAGYNSKGADDPAFDAELQSRGYFCSGQQVDECNKGIMKLELELVGRNDSFADKFGFDHTEELNIRLDDIILGMNYTASEEVSGECRLYRDLNSDGDLQSSDTPLALAGKNGKKLLFQDIRLSLSAEKGDRNAIHDKFQLLVSCEDEDFLDKIKIVEDGEEVTYPAIKSIEVKARNSSAPDAQMKISSVFADKSLYAQTALASYSAEKFVSLNPDFELLGDKIVLPSGEHNFEEDVIIPRSLDVSIAPGSKIYMAPGVSLVSYSPIEMVGTKSKPIVIYGQPDQPFGTFAVIGDAARDYSMTVDYVKVSDGYEATVNGAYLSGMFSIYRVKNVEVTNSEFANAHADDGLNIKYGEVVVSGNTLSGNNADAFDGDFITGKVYENYFQNNGNDALDYSGSNLDIYDNEVQSSGDKCVSVGEKTTARVYDNVFSDCEIAVEVKDLSFANIYGNTIKDARSSAFNAYVKKPFYGKPTFDIHDNQISGGSDVATGLVDADDVRDQNNVEEK